MANSDPAALRPFIRWTRRYHTSNAVFTLSMHLHEGNDEEAAKRYWENELDLVGAQFYKTFIKPAGTGHRKNHLAHGVCRTRMRRSTDAWIRTMQWIEVLRDAPAALS